MNKKQIPAWRKKLIVVNNLIPLVFLFLIAGLMLFWIQNMHTMQITHMKMVEDIPKWVAYALIAFSYVLLIPAAAMKTSAWREAYAETIQYERNIQRIAKILHHSPMKCSMEITRFIKQGKLAALYVDKERGVVVVSHEEADAEAPQAALDGAAPRPAGEPISVVCPGCGAHLKVGRGKTAECEYCGTVVEGQ